MLLHTSFTFVVERDENNWSISISSTDPSVTPFYRSIVKNAAVVVARLPGLLIESQPWSQLRVKTNESLTAQLPLVVHINMVNISKCTSRSNDVH